MSAYLASLVADAERRGEYKLAAAYRAELARDERHKETAQLRRWWRR